MTRARAGGARVESAPIDARASAQRAADVLAAALHTGVEIVDRDLVRLAAAQGTTWRRERAPRPSLYVTAMRTRLPAWADDADAANGAVAVFPIIVADEAVGAIALQSALAEQGTALSAQRRRVADLIAAVAEPLRDAAGWRSAGGGPARAGGLPAAVLESLSDGVLAVDPAGVVLYCNRTALEMLRTEMDLAGQILSHAYPPAAEHRGAPALLQTREVVFERHGRRFRCLETRGPLRGGNGRAGSLIVLRVPGEGVPVVRSSPPTLEEAERQLIDDALARHGTSGAGKRRAARALGISLSTLYRKLRTPAVRSKRR